MAFAGMNGNFAIDDLKDKAIRLVYADAPPSSKVSLKRLRLADAVVAVAVNALEKFVNALEGLLVLRLHLLSAAQLKEQALRVRAIAEADTPTEKERLREAFAEWVAKGKPVSANEAAKC